MQVFNKMAFHMEEGDRWFEQALSHIDELDEALRRLLSLAEKMAGDRKELAHSGEMLSKVKNKIILLLRELLNS